MLVNAFDVLKPIIENHKKQFELSIEAQLSDLLKRGLLEIETEHPILIRDIDGGTRMEQAVKLRLKDKEYIEELERKVAIYEKILAVINAEVGR